MKTGDFIYTSKRMVKEYVNRYVDGTNHISSKDVQVIGFHEDPSIIRLLLTTPTSEEYYGVSYDKENEKLNSYIYKKVGQRVIGKKNRNRFYNDYRYGIEGDNLYDNDSFIE